MANGLISVIIPTLNAERTLEVCLGALSRQTVRGDVEVLVVDGGSTDGTRAVAERHGARVVENPWVVPERAKAIGLSEARGEWGVFLDADEELVRADALERRRALLTAHPEVHNVMTAGMRRPSGEPPLSDYANRYGDPFSYFLFRLDGGEMVPDLLARYTLVDDTPDGLVFEVPPDAAMPICDAGSHFFRLSLVRDTLDLDDPTVASRLFMLMSARHRRFGVLRGDYVLHHAATTPRGLWRKIDWRVRNNTYVDAESSAGHASRADMQPGGLRRRQFAFLPYALLVVPALIDGVRLAMRHRNPAMLLHGPLATATAVDVLVHRAAAAAGLRFPAGSYGRPGAGR